MHIRLRCFPISQIFLYFWLLLASEIFSSITISSWWGFEYRKALLSKKILTLYLVIFTRFLIFGNRFPVVFLLELKLKTANPVDRSFPFLLNSFQGLLSTLRIKYNLLTLASKHFIIWTLYVSPISSCIFLPQLCPSNTGHLIGPQTHRTSSYLVASALVVYSVWNAHSTYSSMAGFLFISQLK